jgi:hypothetical protein
MHGKRLRKSPLRYGEFWEKLGGTFGSTTAKKIATRVITPIITATGAATLGVGSSAYGLAKGYDEMGKTKTGAHIVKDSRMMPGKI